MIINKDSDFFNEVYQDDVEVFSTEEMEAMFDAMEASKPVQYHEPCSCNKCGVGRNKLTIVSFVSEGCVGEYSTKCQSCGFEDHWGYGFFESSSEIGVNCETYSLRD